LKAKNFFALGYERMSFWRKVAHGLGFGRRE
jgi:hypothetical protein